MSNELVPSGGGAVVPAGDHDGALGDYVGDVSLDRSAFAGGSLPTLAPASEQTALAGARYMRSRWDPLVTRLGLNAEQRKIVDATLLQVARTAEALDQEAKVETQLTLLERWGKENYNYHMQTVTEFLIDICGGQKGFDRLNFARAEDACGLTCNADLVDAFLAAARKMADLERKLATEGGERRRDTAPGATGLDSARRQEIEAMMSDRDSPYWRDEQIQAEYRELIAQGAKNDQAPRTTDKDLERRITEIEGWMGTRKYTEAVQAELRELYDRRAQRSGQ